MKQGESGRPFRKIFCSSGSGGLQLAAVALAKEGPLRRPPSRNVLNA